MYGCMHLRRRQQHCAASTALCDCNLVQACVITICTLLHVSHSRMCRAHVGVSVQRAGFVRAVLLMPHSEQEEEPLQRRDSSLTAMLAQQHRYTCVSPAALHTLAVCHTLTAHCSQRWRALQGCYTAKAKILPNAQSGHFCSFASSHRRTHATQPHCCSSGSETKGCVVCARVWQDVTACLECSRLMFALFCTV